MTSRQDLRIRYYPDPVLLKRAQEVPEVTEEIRDNVQQMLRIMYQEGGIGLAGPQVGWLERLFVMNLTGDPEQAEEERVFINPVVTHPVEEGTAEEGCLSFPEIRVQVTRPEQVHVAALGLDGEPFQLQAEGMLARCIQHEVDHLDGILFLHRISITTKLGIRKSLKELERKYKEERQAG
ncbi:MAG: peptide deformylase [Planctomycetota bacterium]